jgi:hypothetical protein
LCNNLLSVNFNPGKLPCCHPVALDTLDHGHILANQVEPGITRLHLWASGPVALSRRCP